eukprot:8071139-Pyramimonas_sp.AAC.1
MHADCEAARAAADGTLAIAADYELSRLTALAAEEVGRRMKVTSHYVKAHDGHPWNELADSIAKNHNHERTRYTSGCGRHY